jgi:hypothetical protein
MKTTNLYQSSNLLNNYSLKIISVLFFLLMFNESAFAQYCGAATTNVAITPTGTSQNTASYNTGRRAFNFAATAGCTYVFSTCGLSTNDTYLRLYSTATGGTVLATGDDNCGTQSQITWTCPTTGNYSVLLTRYLCNTLTAATRMSYSVSCAAPYNPCTAIPVITCGVSNTVTFGAGNGIYNPPSTSCGFATPGQEKIFSFTPTTTGNYSISQPTSFDYIDWFYKAASGGCNGTGWTCIDDITNANVGNGSVVIPLTAGTTYYFMGDPEGTTGGNVTFVINCPPAAPANDLVCNATAITCGQTLSGTTIGASNSGTGENGTCDVTQNFNGVWYSVAGNGQTMTASLCGTAWDSKISVFSGASCAALTCLGGNDDGGPACATTSASYSWASVVGTNYYILVHGYSTNSAFNIGLTCFTPNWLAQFQSMNIGSSNWCAGEVRNVTVTVKNAGAVAWTDATPDINIGVKWNADLDYNVRVNAGALAPGATATYTFSVTAPLTAGNENLSFDVVNEGNFWFATNANGAGPGNAVYTSTGLVINPYPVASAGTNTSICVGNTTQLNGTSSLTFTNNILETNFNNGAWPAGWTRTDNGITGFTDFPTSLEYVSFGNTWAGNGYTGYCSYFYSYIIGNGILGDMISPSMNLSTYTNATLTFWIYNSDGTDVLRVYANTNNGAYAQVGTTYATYGAWTQISISLNAYCGGANTNVKLKFTGTADYGNSNIGIDDIIVQSAVTGTPTNAWTSSPVGFTSAILTPNVSPSSTTNYSLTATYNGCANTSSVLVTIDNPIISPAPATGDYIWRGSTSTGWSVASNWYVYNGTSYSVASVASTNNDDVIIPANGTCIIQQPIVGVPGSAQNITVNSGASLTLNSGSTITAKNITIAATGTLSMDGAANSTLNVSGNWQDNGTFNAGVGTVNFNGTTAQSINKNSGNEVFANLIVNKTSNALTLNSAIEIGTNITLTSGLVNSDATNLLIINDNATATGASNTSHVVGPVRKIGNEAFTFPVGKGNNYAPAAIGAPSLTTDHFTAEYFNTNPNASYNVALKDNTINNISACEYWIIDRSAGLSNVTVNLSWNTPRSCGVNDPAALLLARWNGSSWIDHGNGGTTGNNTAGSINTAAVVTNFSPFTLASTSPINPLPIELTKYDLSCENKKVVINWSTASELNNNFYTIERSADGLTFESIAFVNGNGTTVTKNNYSYTDTNPIDGLSYYQLKQTDYNGQSKTYSLRAINCENKNSDVIIYPNPNKGMFTIQGTEIGCEVTITDVFGKVIYSIKGNEQKTQVNLQNLSSGIYYININKNDTSVTKKIAIN